RLRHLRARAGAAPDPPHPGPSDHRHQEHGRRQRRTRGELHHHDHAAGRHLARAVPRHAHARQGDGRARRVRSGQACVDRTRRVTATVSVVWHTAKAQSVEAAKRTEIVMAATVPSNSSSFIPTALNDLAGTKFKMVRGFQGSPPMALAMERGEVDAIGGMSWEAIQTTKPDWLAEKKIKVLYVQGANRLKELPNDPGLLDFASDEKSRKILGLLGGGPDIGRAMVAEPGIPAERGAALRKALMATLADPEFVADMLRRNLNIEPLAGEEVQRIVASAVATPKELVEQAKRYAGQ